MSRRSVIVLALPAIVVAALGIGVASPVAASTPSPYSWGDNNMGQLGDGTRTDRNTPTPVSMPAGVTFTSISAGAEHACALDSTGKAYCWGENEFGQLGNGQSGPTLFETVPTAVVGGRTFTSITASGYSTCALDTLGAAYCWGSNLDGELGDGTRTDRDIPTAVTMPSGITFTSISGGFFFVCALDALGAAYCWGSNFYGQLGDGSTTDRNVPTAVTMPTGITFTNISGGARHACALTASGAGYCWGGNSFGQLGVGSTTNRNVPTAFTMPTGITFTKISLGGLHSCALTAGGSAYCWGDNFYGQLGDGTGVNRTTPTAVSQPSGVTFSGVALGFDSSCGLTATGVAYCVGRNAEGQLGNGTFVDSNSVTTVSGGYDFASIWSGSSSYSSYAFLRAPNASDSAASFSFLLPDGQECTAISPVRVTIGSMVTLPSVDADCRTMPGASVQGWTIPVPAGFNGFGSSSSPFPAGLPVLVVDSQRFTVVPYEPVLRLRYDANVVTSDACTANPVTHVRERIADVWVPRAELPIARFPTQAACTPPGHTLSGWNTTGNGTGATYQPGSALPPDWAKVSTNTRTLFAVWRAT